MDSPENETEIETTELGHAEQLAQQQPIAGTPVHILGVSSLVHVHEIHGLSIYTCAADDTGALWERWSFWPRGHWEEVTRPTR